MKKALMTLFAGLVLGAFAAAQAKLPPAPPKSEQEKKAEEDKAAATKAKDAADLNKAMDKAIANYKRGHPGGAQRQAPKN
jgi:gas vesicle protein